MTEPDARGPGVLIPPPLYFVTGFLLGLAAERWIHTLPIVPSQRAPVFGILGIVVAAAGVALAAWALFAFARAHTAIVPVRRASQLVQGGPYRFTRNPMYLGLTAAYVGLAALFNSVWPLLLLPVVITTLKWSVIEREEAYLEREFGEAYDEYRRRVRRWL